MDLETKKLLRKHWTESKYLYYGLLLFWLVINLIQSGFTELIHDEAYYFYYSTDLAWGYFDHPPMIALFIKLGTLLTTNELGVRLMVSLSSVIVLAIVIKIAEVKNYFLFFVLWFSVLIVHVGGFIAVPDMPLIFFSIIFFILYRNYLKNDSWQHIILLALTIAALLYSKYTGVLVVFFTVISNLKLLKQRSFWIIALLASILMIPHLLWQVRHDFVTPYYHLVERTAGFHFKWQSVYDFVLGQLGILNPLIALLLFYFGIVFKPRDSFDRALKYNAFGVLILGLVMSFRGPVEANWTSTAFIPLIIIAYRGMSVNVKVIKAIYIIGLVSAVFIIALRGIMIVNYLPEQYKHHFRVEFHNWDTWAQELHKKAGEKPVVFINSYQRASKYFYYAKKSAYSYATLTYRKSEFDINGVEKKLFDDEVIIFHNDKAFGLIEEILCSIPNLDSLMLTSGEKVYFTILKNYRTYNFLLINFEIEEHEYKAGTSLEIPITLSNPTGIPIKIENDSIGCKIAVAFYQKEKVVFYKEVYDITGLTIGDEYRTKLTIKAPEEAGEYYCKVVIRSGWLPPGLNSRIQKVNIK